MYIYLCVSSGSALNDGQWHSVELISRRGRLTIAVDGDEGATAHASPSFLIATGQLFFGGKRGMNKNITCINLSLLSCEFLIISNNYSAEVF